MQPLLTPLTSNHAVYIGRYRIEFREPFGNPVSYCQIPERFAGVMDVGDFEKLLKGRLENQILELLQYSVEHIDINFQQNRVEIVRKRDFRTTPLQLNVPGGPTLTVHFHPWIPQEPPLVARPN